MKVSELIEQLQELPQDLDVWRAKDDEGNGFDEVYTLEEYVMTEDGDIGFRELTPELKELGYNEDDIFDGEDVIIIW